MYNQRVQTMSGFERNVHSLHDVVYDMKDNPPRVLCCLCRVSFMPVLSTFDSMTNNPLEHRSD